MLGSVRSSKRPSGAWQWAAIGKHPVAKDYIQVGSMGPILGAFSSWMEEGYRVFGSAKRPLADAPCSWRFWAKGAKKETLVCGVLRDSSDSVGRPFPLLIVGTGALADWRDAWDLLPMACERTWGQLEYLCVKRFGGFEQFESEVLYTRAPSAQWTDFRCENPGEGDPLTVSREDLAGFCSDGVLCLGLDGPALGDVQTWTCRLHAMLKGQDRQCPNAVFMGGTSQQIHAAVFRRPLRPSDFVRLWSGGRGLEEADNAVGGAVGGHRLDV